VNGQSCGCIGTVDSERNFAQSYNQIQTLKKCSGCHIYCAPLCAHLRAIVTSSCTVSNRESRYPPPDQLLTKFSYGFFRKDYGNRNRKKHVPAVVSFAKQGTETETTYGPGRPTRPPEAKILRRQAQKRNFEMLYRKKWSSKKSRDANSHPCPRRCLGSWCTWRARCVAAFNNQKKVPDVLSSFPANSLHVFDTVLLLYSWPCSYVYTPFLSACLQF